MAGICNPRKCTPKKLCFNCAERERDTREAWGLPRYQGAVTGRWPLKQASKIPDAATLKLIEIGTVLRSLPLIEVQCRSAGLYATAMEVRKAVQRSGFEAEELIAKLFKKKAKKKKTKA